MNVCCLYPQAYFEPKDELKISRMNARYIITLVVWMGSLMLLSAQTERARVSQTIDDKEIVYPESMTGQLSDLLHSWQLDLSKAETDCERGEGVAFHDSVYMQRLHRLPSEMEMTFNSVVKKYIEMYAFRKREQVSYMLALGSYYFPMFEQMLDREGLPLELKYLPVIESALNPVAVSRAGATGLWQFMLRTGKGYGLEVNSLVDERRDPYKSTEAAVRYLKDLYTIYSDWNLVIAAYNCGPGNVNKAIARSGGKHDYWEIYFHLPRETRGYVPAFIAANYIMNHYADHHICPAHSFDAVAALDTVAVRKRMHFGQIAGVLGLSLDALQRMNPQFKKEIIPGDFKPYVLVLPTAKMTAYIHQHDSIVNYRIGTFFTHRANTERYVQEMVSNSDHSVNVYYRVRRGDNLSTIAKRYGTTVSRIKSWNGMRSNRLSVGKRLIVGKRALSASKKDRQNPEKSDSARRHCEMMVKQLPRIEMETGERILSTYLERQEDRNGKKREFPDLKSIQTGSLSDEK